MANIVTIKPGLSIEELYSDIDQQREIGQLAVYLNRPPKQEWIKVNKYANNSLYLPIDRLEFMMSYFFGEWHVEIKDSKMVANSLVVTVRVHYRSAFLPQGNGEWKYTDGIGAVPIQISKDGSGAIDFAHINPNAIQMGMPAAESYAFKDAVEKLGRIFGKDLNRKDVLDYGVILGTEQEPRFPENITEPDLTKNEDESDLPDFMRSK